MNNTLHTTAKLVWESVRASLQKHLAANEYGLWIKPLQCLEMDGTCLKLGGPDRFFCSWIKDRYLPLIRQALESTGFTGCRIELTISDTPQLQLENDRSNQLRLPGVTAAPRRIRSLHPAYTFDHFMVGDSNLLACSACSALARGERTYGSNLFINSTTGLGKSHLTQAVVHQILREAPSTRFQYLTAQQFSAEMVQGIKNKDMEQFSRKFVQDCDMLLVEDVHTLNGKNKTQEELNTILDYLIRSGKRVIMTSALAPHQLAGIDEDFRSRMSSGLVTQISEPDFATRVAIVRHKAQLNQLELNEEIVDFLARHLHGDVRRTESAIIGIKARACVRKSLPDMDMVKAVLQGVIGKPAVLSAGTIRDFVGCEFKVSTEDLASRSRKRAVSFPRQIAMYLTRKYTDASLSDIGELYNRDHSTVLHAIQVITRDMSSKTSIREQVELLCRKLHKE